MLEIAISCRLANATIVLMGLSKAIEKRHWPFDQPLKQFDLKQDVLYGLDRFADDFSVSELAAMTAIELGRLIHSNENHGNAVLNAAKQFPTVHMNYSLRPLGSDILKIAVRVQRVFEWNAKVHGTAEPFLLWVEDHDGDEIRQLAHLILRPDTTHLDAEFVITIPRDALPKSVTIRYLSDRWMGAENEMNVPFASLVMPTQIDSHTPRFDLPFLPTSTITGVQLSAPFERRLNSLNALQTQMAWSVIRTELHTLVCAPAGSGKTLLIEILAT